MMALSIKPHKYDLLFGVTNLFIKNREGIFLYKSSHLNLRMKICLTKSLTSLIFRCSISPVLTNKRRVN